MFLTYGHMMMKQKNKKNKPLQQGTANCVFLYCLQWIYLHDVHNINQKPRHLKTQTKRRKRRVRKNTTHLYSGGQQMMITYSF